MKKKNDCNLKRIDKPICLRLLLKNDIKRLNALSAENLSDIDKSVHEIRKFLKTTLSLLLLYRTKYVWDQYPVWKSYFKRISKQYAAIREFYVYKQTFNKIIGNIKYLDNKFADELAQHFELKDESKIEKDVNIKETIRQLNESALEISTTLENLDFKNSLLKKNYTRTFRKTKKLFKNLTLNSPSADYHKFRIWCKNFYLQHSALHSLGLQMKPSCKAKKIDKITEYLGDEHDLELFYQYMRKNSMKFSNNVNLYFLVKIKKLRSKAIHQYLKILKS